MRILLVAVLLAVSSCAGSTAAVAPGSISGDPTRPLELSAPAHTPPIDVARASVELDQVIFDTFGRRPRFSLADADATAIAELFDAIAPLDAPSYHRAAEATWLAPDDLVLGYVDPAGEAWAFPVRILNFHEIVNDELGGQPVAVTYCPLCGSGVVFDRGAASFSNTSALYENDMVMVDRETGSYWWQVRGEAIVGPRTGDRLGVLPSQMATFEDWVATHPQSAVLVRPAERDYTDPFIDYAARIDEGLTPFPVRESVFDDDRLRPSAVVVVIETGPTPIAVTVVPARTIELEAPGGRLVVETDGVGARVSTGDGEQVGTTTAFWFAALAAFDGLELHS